MKRVFALCLLALAPVAAADYYYGDHIDTYDPVSGLYYKAVVDKERGGLMSSKAGSGPINLAIANPATGATALLFKEPLNGSIASVLFEIGYKEGSIEFAGSGEGRALDNKNVARREPKNKLLVVVNRKEGNGDELYVADKDGGNLKKLALVPRSDDWHIDVRNSKLRVVHQTGSGITIDSFDW